MAERDPKVEAKQVAIIVQDALRSMADSVQDIVSDALGNLGDVSDATLKDIEKGFRDLSKVGQTLAKTSELALQGDLSRSKVNKIILDRKAKQEALDINIEILNQDISNLTEEQRRELEKLTEEQQKSVEYNKLVEKSLEKQYKQSKKINQAQGLSGTLLGGMEKITKKMGMSGLSDVFADAKSAAGDLANKLTKGGTKAAGLGGKIKIAGKGMGTALSGAAKYLMGPAGIAMLIAKAVQFMLKLDAGTSKTAQSLNISTTEAADLRKNLMASAENMDYMTERLDDAIVLMSQFADGTGIISKNTDVFNQELGVTQRLLGFTNDQVNDLSRFLIATGQSTEEFRNNVIGSAEATEVSLGVNVQLQSLMKDVANLTDRQRLNLEANPTLIGKAVAQARALGLNFQMLEGSMSGLLDFESSIGNELEAELLLNKDLNLERARAAALQNDYATVAAEVSKNIGTAAEFQNMNRIAQEALAKSVNMTVDDLAKALIEQEALEKSGFKSAEARKKAFDTLVKEKGMREAVATFGDQEFARLQESISLQDRFNNLINNLKVIFTESLAPEVEKFSAMLKSNPELINNIVDSIKDFATGVMNVGTFINGLIVKPITATVNLVKSLVQGISALAKFSSFDIMGGMDMFKKAGNSLAMSGANVLDIGTNLLVGGGVEGESNYFSNRAKEIAADDFTIKTNPKDTLVMAGGTRFGEETNKLLRELISAVKEGGDVVMDGNKVGQAINLAAYRTTTA